MKNQLFKEEIKKLTLELRKRKQEVKDIQRSGNYAGREQYTLLEQRSYARNVFIAYAIYRNVPLEKLEGKPDIEYDHDTIQKIITRLTPSEKESV